MTKQPESGHGHEGVHDHATENAMDGADARAHAGFEIHNIPSPPAAPADYLSAVVELLIEKGIVAGDEIRRRRQVLRARGPRLGARVVARAWTDESFRSRLAHDAVSAVRELGIEPLTPTQGSLIALENSADLHHVVVCTLCSCYPNALLGPAPEWYRSEDYRHRVVVEPRVVLREFGLELPPNMTIRVVDSTAEHRYLVIPRRPVGSEKLSIDELESLVSEESMVGTSEALTP